MSDNFSYEWRTMRQHSTGDPAPPCTTKLQYASWQGLIAIGSRQKTWVLPSVTGHTQSQHTCKEVFPMFQELWVYEAHMVVAFKTSRELRACRTLDEVE